MENSNNFVNADTHYEKESYLVSDIIKSLYPKVWLFRINVGTVKKAGGGTFKSGPPAGFPDLFGYRRCDQKVVFIECKMPGNNPSPKQCEFIDRIRADGAIVGVAYSVADAWKIAMGDKQNAN